VEEVENWPEGRYTVLLWRMMKVPDSYCQWERGRWREGGR